MKITFLIHDKAPFSHQNIYAAYKDCLLEKIPDLICCTIEQFLLNPVPTQWIFIIDHYRNKFYYRFLKDFARLAIYILEDPYEIDQTRFLSSSEIDCIFTNDEGSVDFRRNQYGQKVAFLPLACRDTIFYPNPTEDKKYKLVMIGNAFPNRVDFIEQLSQFILDNEIDFHIFGINWSRLKAENPFITIHKGIITETQLAQIYNSSETALEINRTFQIHNENNVPAITPGRGFSSLGCSCHTITDERLTSKQYFPEDGISYYHSMDELKELILMPTLHKLKIAKKGSLYVKQQQHTFKHRVETLLNALS